MILGARYQTPHNSPRAESANFQGHFNIKRPLLWSWFARTVKVSLIQPVPAGEPIIT